MERNEVKNNREARRYELVVDGLTASIDYFLTDNEEIVLVHTGVPHALQGRGIGSRLIEKTLEEIKRQNLRVIPQCPFVAEYIRRHPRWEHIVAGVLIE